LKAGPDTNYVLVREEQLDLAVGTLRSSEHTVIDYRTGEFELADNVRAARHVRLEDGRDDGHAGPCGGHRFGRNELEESLRREGLSERVKIPADGESFEVP